MPDPGVCPLTAAETDNINLQCNHHCDRQGACCCTRARHGTNHICHQRTQLIVVPDPPLSRPSLPTTTITMFAGLPSQPSLVIDLDARDEAILIASHGTRRRLMSPLRRSSLSPSGAPRTTAPAAATTVSFSSGMHKPHPQQLSAIANPDGHTQEPSSECEIFQSITMAPALQRQSFEVSAPSLGSHGTGVAHPLVAGAAARVLPTVSHCHREATRAGLRCEPLHTAKVRAHRCTALRRRCHGGDGRIEGLGLGWNIKCIVGTSTASVAP